MWGRVTGEEFLKELEKYFFFRYNVCLGKGSDIFGPVCDTTQYLSIPLYTKSCSDIIRTLFEAHIVGTYIQLCFLVTFFNFSLLISVTMNIFLIKNTYKNYLESVPC